MKNKGMAEIASDAIFRRLLEAAPDAIVIANQKGAITLVNAQTERLFGYGRDELLGHPVELLIPERFRDAHPGHREGYFANPRLREMGAGLELYGRRRDGREFPVEISLSGCTRGRNTRARASAWRFANGSSSAMAGGFRWSRNPGKEPRSISTSLIEQRHPYEHRHKTDRYSFGRR